MKFFNRATFENVGSRMIVTPAGFKAAVIQNVFLPEAYQKLLAAYPPLSLFNYHEDAFKKVYEGPHYDSQEYKGCIAHFAPLDPIWKELLLEATSEEFMNLFSKSTGVIFNTVRNFSWKYGKEGCEIKPHLDQAAMHQNVLRSRLVSLSYFAAKPGMGPGGTVIYSADRSKTVLEAQDLYNSMLFFEQHKDAWHGYKPMKQGEERRALAMTFNLEEQPTRIKTPFAHKLFCAKCLSQFFS